MRALDYKSVSTVATHIDGLIARGWLVKRDNSARTLEVVSPQDAAAPTHLVGTVASSAEQEILHKIESLKGIDNQKHSDDIEALQRALRILGYHVAVDGLIV